ncbi:MAG: hypothetical protein IKG87_11555 [Clostridia bacterium]|nr:hypothetical protein [Clostridia bacterium]
MEKKANENGRKRAQWLIFAIAVGILSGAVRMAQTGIRGIGDSDYYWHITLGKYILENRSIFREDLFSWIAAERGYVETAHSWLGSVIICLFSNFSSNPIIGAALFTGFTTAAISFAMICVYGSPFDKENPKCDFLNALLSIIIGLAIVLIPVQPRPLNFGLLLFVLAMILLHDGFENPESRKCGWLPAISLLWANLHGGSVPILFAFHGLFLMLSTLPSFSWKGIGQTSRRTAGRIRRFALLWIADTAAALINPYGWRLLIYCFHTNSEATKKYVMEWYPAKLLNFAVLAALLVLLMILLLRNKQNPVELSYLLPVLATLFMTAKYVRIEAYLIFCTLMLIWHMLHTTFGTWIPKKLNTVRVKRITALLATLSVVMIGFSTAVTSDRFVNHDSRAGDPFSQGLLKAIDELQPERMYTTYNDGGYLIYHGYQSFIDSRADLFLGSMLNRAIEFATMKNFSSDELEEYIQEFGFDTILLSRENSLNAWLALHPEWEAAYEDGEYALYRKTEGNCS